MATQGTNDIGSGKNKPKRDYTRPGTANGPKYQKRVKRAADMAIKAIPPDILQRIRMMRRKTEEEADRPVQRIINRQCQYLIKIKRCFV